VHFSLEMISGGIKFTNFPENQLTPQCMHFCLLVFLFISRSQKLIYNVNIKIRQIIDPAAAGPVPTPVRYTCYSLTVLRVGSW